MIYDPTRLTNAALRDYRSNVEYAGRKLFLVVAFYCTKLAA